MRKKILIILGILIVITSGLLISVLNMKGKMISYAMPEEENLTGIAMYVHNGTSYVKSTSVPVNTHVLNRSKTKCEGGGSIVSYNRRTGVLEYRLPTADMCYVYFDKDTTAPTVNSLTLNSGDTYATNKSVTAVLTYPNPEDDWTYYCLTLDSDGSDCTSGSKWQTFSSNGTSMSVTYTFSADGDQTVYAFIKDIASNVSGSASDSIIVDTTAPTNFEYYKIYQIMGTRDYTANGHYSAVGGKGGTWTVSGNDPMITFNDLSDIKGITGAYIKLSEPLSYNLPLQVFYAGSNCAFNETNSAKGYAFAAGQTEMFMPFPTSGTWTCFRFDIGDGTTIGKSYKLAELGVFTTSSTESGASYANWAGEPSTFTRFSAVDVTSGVASFQYYGDGVANWTALNLALSNGVQTSGTTTTGQENWGATDGRNQTYYFRTCDKAGNCSDSLTYKIKYDLSGPTISNISFSGLNELNFTTNDAYSGVKQVCVNQNATSISGCTWQDVSTGANTLKVTYSDVGENYIHVKDKWGHIGHSSAVTITNTIATQVMINPTTGLKYSTSYGGMYRYIGSTANNYVCFGTTDKSTCTGNEDVHMYRILGVTLDGKLKLLKKTTIEDRNFNYGDGKTRWWPNTWMYRDLNNENYLTNPTYFPSGWGDKVALIDWKYGSHNSISMADKNGQENYNTENGFTNIVNAKVGLMYMHDYIWAYSETGVCGTAQNSCKSSWAFLPNNDSDYSADGKYIPEDITWYECTMTGADNVPALFEFLEGDGFYVIYSRGFLEQMVTSKYERQRPVFFLNSNVKWVSGTGTASDPYIIS